jgi:hypothetical protein
MPLSRDLREFIECLNSNKVEYLVVGALAVSWHGFPRYSADIDFLIRPSHANAELVLKGTYPIRIRGPRHLRRRPDDPGKGDPVRLRAESH